MVILHHLVQDIAIGCTFVVHATLPFDERDERLLHASRGSPGSAYVDLERPSQSRTPSNPANSFNEYPHLRTPLECDRDLLPVMPNTTTGTT